jgi:hypothetical protein
MRLLHRLWAWAAGYFWLPCPVCKQEFGGHEWPQGFLRTGENEGLIVCPRCEIRRRRMWA